METRIQHGQPKGSMYFKGKECLMFRQVCLWVLAWPLVAGGVAGAEEASMPVAHLDFRRIVREAKDKVFPAVVYVTCLRESHEPGKKVRQSVSGSGVLISPRGEMVTNWHVVDKALEIRCLLYDGRARDATLVGSDKDTDVAMLSLELPPDEEVPYASLGDSAALQEGDFVMAMGAPWGLSRSVSIGIVSCTQRYLPENSQYSLWLQSDAAISPGNSGGPLVNTDGRIVGINSRGVMYGGDIGFAVPAETLRHILPQLREHGKVNWSWLGLQLQPLRDFERDIYFDETQGVIIAETDPDSPARKAGILARDRMITLAGEPVTALTAEDLPMVRRRIGLLPKEQPVWVEVVRAGQTLRLELTPTEKGRVEGKELDCPRWDMTVKTINRFDNPDLYFHRKEGVFVFGVKYPGNAYESGLQKGDILLAIGAEEIRTLDDVRRIHTASLEHVDTEPRKVFKVLRNGLLRMIVLDFSRDYERQ